MMTVMMGEVYGGGGVGGGGGLKAQRFQGGFRTGFHTVDNCRTPSRFIISSLSLMWMASVVFLCQ